MLKQDPENSGFVMSQSAVVCLLVMAHRCLTVVKAEKFCPKMGPVLPVGATPQSYQMALGILSHQTDVEEWFPNSLRDKILEIVRTPCRNV